MSGASPSPSRAFFPDGSRLTQGWAPRQSADGTRACQWTRPDGQVAGMLWNAANPGPCRLKFLTGDVRLYAADGMPLAARADGNGRVMLTFGAAPVYYVGAEFTRTDSAPCAGK